AGYARSARTEPDIRRYRYISNDGENSPYIILFGNNPDLSSVSRMWLDLDETNLSGMLNLTQKFSEGMIDWEIRTGIFAENRDRSFRARNFGYAVSSDTSPFASTSLPV